MSDPETALGRMTAAEKRLWQQHDAARANGASDVELRELRKAATETAEQRRNLWADLYEVARERRR